jgi:alpha-1,2-mannosyltransferase
MATAAATVAMMGLASLLAFGAECWTAFYASLPLSRRLLVEEGVIGYEKIQSVFAGVRLFGGGVPVAYAAQISVTILVLLAVVKLWRSAADMRLKASAAIAATLLTTPYCLDYDMVVLGPAMAFFLSYIEEKGDSPFEKSILGISYATPLVARATAALTAIPIGVLSTLLFFAIVVRAGSPAAGRAPDASLSKGSPEIEKFKKKAA